MKDRLAGVGEAEGADVFADGASEAPAKDSGEIDGMDADFDRHCSQTDRRTISGMDEFLGAIQPVRHIVR